MHSPASKITPVPGSVATRPTPYGDAKAEMSTAASTSIEEDANAQE